MNRGRDRRNISFRLQHATVLPTIGNTAVAELVAAIPNLVKVLRRKTGERSS